MRLELSRAGTSLPHLYPQKVWQYHGRYNSTTLVPPLYLPPGGGTPVKFPSFLCAEITPGKMTVVPPARGALPTLLHSIQPFCSFTKRPGEAGNS